MRRDKEQNIRIQQVQLREGSPLVDKKLSETKIRKAADVLVIAVRDQNGNYTYNPGPDTILKERATLIVLGSTDSVVRLRDSVAGGSRSVPLIDSP